MKIKYKEPYWLKYKWDITNHHDNQYVTIFDKEKNQLIISRDGLGIKPLYYYQDECRLVFASEIKAIKTFYLI